jgi:hypothetical protein
MRTSGISDDDVSVVLPSLRELPLLDLDEVEVLHVERPSSLTLETDEGESTLDAIDAVEGPSVESILDETDDGSALDDGDGLPDATLHAIDEAPDDDALGDDVDGLGDDVSDLDESLLSSERGDDGADGLDSDSVEMRDPTEPLDGASADDGGEFEPIVLPVLPSFDP